MANETTTPPLPCAAIDDVVPFYEALGFRTKYRQKRPNGHAIVVSDDIGRADDLSQALAR